VEVVLFAGHMIDAPGRRQPRFPPEHVHQVRRDIADAIWLIDGPQVEAVTGLACGGDLLFAEEWLKTDRRLRAFLPREVADFVEESVAFAGAEWVDSFRSVSADPRVEVVGPTPEMSQLEDPHTANTMRMLTAAIGAGNRLQALFVWDGGGGDGPGGTEHLATAVVAAGGGLTIIRP
jgi:hypothetical protein